MQPSPSLPSFSIEVVLDNLDWNSKDSTSVHIGRDDYLHLEREGLLSGGGPLELSKVLHIVVDKRAVVTATDATGKTLLMQALRAWSDENVDALLRHFPEVQVAAVDENGTTPLVWAVWIRYGEGVDALLRYDPEAQVTAVDADGRTPLVQALRTRNYGIVDALLRHRPEAQVMAVDESGLTPLIREIFLGRTKGVAALLQHYQEIQVTARDRRGWTPLMHAVVLNRHIDALLQHFPELQVTATDAVGHTPLMQALHVDQGRPGVIAALLRRLPVIQLTAVDADGLTPLMQLLDRNTGFDSAVVAMFLRHSPEAQLTAVDADGHTPLMRVLTRAQHNYVDRVALLLRYLPHTQLATDTEGRAPLTYVSDVDVAEVLTRAGADPFDARTDGARVGVRQGVAALAECARDASALRTVTSYLTRSPQGTVGVTTVDVTAVDANGMTPLMRAAAEGSAEGVAALLAHEPAVQATATSAVGKTALALTSSGDVAELLTRAGSDPFAVEHDLARAGVTRAVAALADGSELRGVILDFAEAMSERQQLQRKRRKTCAEDEAHHD